MRNFSLVNFFSLGNFSSSGSSVSSSGSSVSCSARVMFILARTVTKCSIHPISTSFLPLIKASRTFSSTTFFSSSGYSSDLISTNFSNSASGSFLSAIRSLNNSSTVFTHFETSSISEGGKNSFKLNRISSFNFLLCVIKRVFVPISPTSFA